MHHYDFHLVLCFLSKFPFWTETSWLELVTSILKILHFTNMQMYPKHDYHSCSRRRCFRCSSPTLVLLLLPCGWHLNWRWIILLIGLRETHKLAYVYAHYKDVPNNVQNRTKIYVQTLFYQLVTIVTFLWHYETFQRSQQQISRRTRKYLFRI